MIRRTHVEPFLREVDGRLEVDFLRDTEDGRVVRFLDRLCRLVTRLEGRSRSTVAEALRRQERRIRDAKRLDGIAKTLLDLCRFRPVRGADRAPDVRRELFEARGRHWPPVPGDERVPYREAARTLEMDEEEIDRLLYADDPGSYELVRAPGLDGEGLLARYNLDLARAVLLDAEKIVVTARGGWRDIFRAVKLARLMYRIEPLEEREPLEEDARNPEVPRGHPSGAPVDEGSGRSPGGRHQLSALETWGRRYRLELTGPASSFITSARRYGTRFVRIVPAVVRAPEWRIEADIVRGERRVPYVLQPGTALDAWSDTAHVPRYDSAWEEDLAKAFREKLGAEREGWTLAREDTPVPLGEELFLPDFTFRHEDGRTALVEVVGFWAPEYLENKLRKVRRAGLDNLVLVVYRGLAAGDEVESTGGAGRAETKEGRAVDAEAEDSRSEEVGGPRRTRAVADIEEAGTAEVVWFVNKPLIGPVMEAVERAAR